VDLGLCYNGDMSTRPAILPSDFSLSQSSLQTYSDCKRRFWLTYIRQLPWPAVEVTPIQEHETMMRLGKAFHRLVQRAEIGIDPDLLAADLPDPLHLWFSGYRHHRPQDVPTGVLEIEYSISVPLNIVLPDASSHAESFGQPHTDDQPAYRLTALFDLLAVQPGERAVIIDWKTARYRPNINSVQRRFQSRVYPYVLVEASRHLPWGPLDPEQVEMRYWYTAAPDQPINFRYDSAQHAENGREFRRILAEIVSKGDEDDFPLVDDTEANRQRLCRFCTYRTRCDRGSVAGSLLDLDAPDSAATWMALEDDLETAAPADLTFDLGDIQELAF
jgi:hypothetical protein